MNITVLGCGGVGGFYGAKLAAAGNRVTFMARGGHLAAIQQSGLKVKSMDGDIHILPAIATEKPTEPADLILVCTKVWQIAGLESVIRNITTNETIILPLCNGIEAPEILASMVNPDQVMAGLCRIYSYIASPGIIEHPTISHPPITFGEVNNKRTDRSEKILKLFTDAGIKANLSQNIQIDIWNKFVFIAAVSAMGSVTRSTYGVYGKGELRNYLTEMITEMVSLALATGVNLSADFCENTMAYIDKMPLTATTSMQRDMMDGKPSELDSQIGAVVRLAEKTGIDVPVCKMIYALLQPQEKKARGIDS